MRGLRACRVALRSHRFQRRKTCVWQAFASASSVAPRQHLPIGAHARQFPIDLPTFRERFAIQGSLACSVSRIRAPRHAHIHICAHTRTHRVETRTHTHMRAYTYTQSRHTNTCAHTQTNTDASRCKVPYHGHVKIDESSCHSWGGVSDVRSLQIETWLHGLIVELARAAAIKFITFVLISDLENLLVF